jgi:uncharacterized RDD family membrane protein YckC
MSRKIQSDDFHLAYQNVKSTIALSEVDPEDAEQLYGVIKPLELALRTVEEEPSGDSAADKIARLLWCKSHLNGLDPVFIIQTIKDDNLLVRTIAVSALRTFLTTSEAAIDHKLLFQMQRAVQDQSRNEPSQLLSYLLDELTTELSGRLLRASRLRTVISTTNPFIAGVPIRSDEAFFGRVQLINELKESFLQQGAKGVVLFGARRTGKTSLLLHIQRGALGENFAPVFIDVQSAAGKKRLVPLVLRALAENWPSLVDPLGRLTEDDAVDFNLLNKAVRSVIKHLNGKRLLLMFDEYEVLDSFFPDRASAARMLSMFENQPALLALYAGPTPLNDVRNKYLLSLLEICKYLPISFLDPADAERLIREPAADTLEFSDSAVSSIQLLCGGHPFYIQLLCQSIFTLKGGAGTADDGDVNTAVKRLIANPPPHLVLTWQDLDRNDRLVASALASIAQPDRGGTAQGILNKLAELKFPNIPSKASVHKGLAALRRADLIRNSDEASAAHVFTMDFVRRWIADSRTVWDVLEEGRKDVFSRTAPRSRRLCATAIDLGVMAVLVIALIFNVRGYPLYLALASTYYVAFILVSDRTVAMRLLRLRLVSEDGTQVKLWRSLLFALFLTIEAASLGLLVVAAVVTGGFWLWLVAATLLFVGLLNQLQVVFHRQHRGLYDRLAHVLLIYEP